MNPAQRFNRRPVPIEVRTSNGKWRGGFLLIGFRDDGRVTVRSTKTGKVKLLQQGHWRDPVELQILAAHGIPL